MNGRILSFTSESTQPVSFGTRSRSKLLLREINECHYIRDELSNVEKSLPAGRTRRRTSDTAKRHNVDELGSKSTGLLTAESRINLLSLPLTIGSPVNLVNSDYLPIPWKGRLGYACLNTILRELKPPIFCSRTCRLATIHGSNSKEGKGMEYCKILALENVRDLQKILEWNVRFGIYFMRISSEMFPFAAHPEVGYHLDFADSELRAAGAIARAHNIRLTMHPGQFTQLGSPRKVVIENSIRDLEYHDELLTRLNLPNHLDRDAVMVIHMGGTYGDKAATLERFKKTYNKLAPSIKRRLVLENCDMGWSVDDLLGICQRYHWCSIGIIISMSNMLYSSHLLKESSICPGNLREGSKDVKEKHVKAITNIWEKKKITIKQHYSEPRVGAITPMQRRAHSKRVCNLPPCANDMDLMIEAKDKEQAVFELRRIFQLRDSCPPLIQSPPSYESTEGYYMENDEIRLKPLIKKRARNVSKALSVATDVGI